MLRIFCLILILLPFQLYASEKVYQVGVASGEPFVITRNNEFHGIAIDLWKLLADDQKLKYQFVPMGENIDEAINALADGKIDILIGPIVPTLERYQRVDFTRPYFLNQISAVVPVKGVHFIEALSSIFKGDFKWAFLVFLLFFLIYIHIFWYYESRTHFYNVSPNYLQGILTVFWLHTLDIGMTHPPTHRHTRLFRFLWILILALFFTSITATITSALTVALAKNYQVYDSLDDFQNIPVSAVVGTAPLEVAKTMGLNIVPVQDRTDGIQLLLDQKVGGFVDYHAIAEYYLTEHQLRNRLTLAFFILKQDTFAFALPLGSPLRYPFNLKMSALQNYGLVKPICEKYFIHDSKSVSNCDI